MLSSPGDWARSDAPVIAALTTLLAAKSRWGFWKCCDRLRRVDYNTRRPHSSLGHLTPSEFVTQRQEEQDAEEVVCSS